MQGRNKSANFKGMQMAVHIPVKRNKINVRNDVKKNWKPLSKVKKDVVKKILKQSFNEVVAVEPELKSTLTQLCRQLKVEYESVSATPTDLNGKKNISENEIESKNGFVDSKIITEQISDVKRQLYDQERDNETMRLELKTAKDKLDDIQSNSKSYHRLMKPERNYLSILSLSPKNNKLISQ